MRIKGQRVCIIVPSGEARGTSRVVSDYKSYFEKLGAMVEIKSPPQNWPRWRILAWEILALYLKGCRRDDILLSPNGRISPRVFWGHRRVYIIVLLDTMNAGLRRLLSYDFRLTEKLNILINSILMPPSILGSSYLTAISEKTARDFKNYLNRGSENFVLDRASKSIVIYPGGSFSDSALDSSESHDKKRHSVGGAIWISGETRNKGFMEGVGLLKSYASELDIRDASIYGIRSAKNRNAAIELMVGRDCRLIFEAVNTKEERLIQCYLDSKVALCLSKEEGYGIPFLDALMMGIPVVARKIDTYLEIINMVRGLVGTVPPVLWIQQTRQGKPYVNEEMVRIFKTQRSEYCMPSEAQRIERYKEINDSIQSRSVNTLARHLV